MNMGKNVVLKKMGRWGSSKKCEKCRDKSLKKGLSHKYVSGKKKNQNAELKEERKVLKDGQCRGTDKMRMRYSN